MNAPRAALFVALALGLPALPGPAFAHSENSKSDTTQWWCWQPSAEYPVEHCWLSLEKVEQDPASSPPKGIQCAGSFNPSYSSSLKRKRYDYGGDGRTIITGCVRSYSLYVCDPGLQVAANVPLNTSMSCVSILTPPPDQQVQEDSDEAFCAVLRTFPQRVSYPDPFPPGKLCHEVPTQVEGLVRFCELDVPKGITVSLPDPLVPGYYSLLMEFTGNTCTGTSQADGPQCVREAGMDICDLQSELGCFKLDGVNVCERDIPAGGCTMAGAKQVCDSTATAPPAVDDGTAGVKATPAVTVELKPKGGTARSIDIFDGATVVASSAPPEGEDAKGDPLKEGETGGGDALCKEFPNVVACQPRSVVLGGSSCLSPPVCSGGDAALCALLHQSWQDRCGERMLTFGVGCDVAPTCTDPLSTNCQTVLQIWQQRCSDDGSGGSGGTGTASGGDSCDAAPTCSGDEIQCNILKQEWHTRCDALGTTASNDAILSGKGDQSVGTLVQDTVNLGESLEATEVFSNACPPDVQLGPFTIAGTSQGPWAIQSATFCGLFSDARPFVLAAAWIGAAFIVLGAGRSS